MATSKPINPTAVTPPTSRFQLSRYLPVLTWSRQYRREWLSGDLMAGIIVAIMLVPQGMAYALLAGLPPEAGLYASILPLFLYGLLGTSRTLAVGPVAIVSILVAAGVSGLAEPGSPEYAQFALTLALLVGLIQWAMGLFRIGFLVNFLSHPVLAGFTSAAALVIGFSQLKHLLGLSMPNLEFFETAVYVAEHIQESNLITFAIGATSIAILLVFKYLLGGRLKRWGVSPAVAAPLTKSAPLIIVLLGTAVVILWGLKDTAGVKVVGSVPAGLPPLTLPIWDFSVWRSLLPTAVTISFVGFMESVSVAKSLASKRRQKIDSDQELVALGIANIGATFTGGFPVTGGFSRSVVNFEGGAHTGLASMVTAVLIAITLLFFTPLFYYLPQAVLAAIILVAVVGLIDLKTFRHVWQYNKADAASMLITFTAVLIVGIETGILVGVAAAMLLFVWRTSRPHTAVIGRLGESETYLNVLRHPVQTCAKVAVVRIDESLYFANTAYLEETVLNQVAEQPEIEHFVLVGTAVNFIDASALETLESLRQELADAGVTFHLAAVKGPVMDRLQKIGFAAQFGSENIHLTTHEAMKSIGCVS